MAYRYALRTDKAFVAVRDFVVARGYSGFAVREVAGDANEHFHWYLECSLKIAALRMALTRAIPDLRGNAAYSLSECKDAEKYQRYMAKGESDGSGASYAWRHGLLWTDEKLEELHEQYWTENRKLKKRKTGSVFDAVYDKCKADEIRWSHDEAIVEMYIRELVSRDKPINIFAVRNNVALLKVKLCPDDRALKELVDKVVN